MEHKKLNEVDDSKMIGVENRKKSSVGILRTVVAMAVAAIAMMPKNAKADESYGVGVELGPDVNWIQPGEGCPTVWMVSSGGAQLMSGYKQSRLKLIFSGAYYDKECNSGGATLAKELEILDSPDGGVIARGLGKALPLDSSLINEGANVIEVDRGDGRTAKIKSYGNDKIFKDGELKWDGNKIIDYGPDWGQSTTGLSTVHNSIKPNHVKLVGFGSFYVKAWENNLPPYASWGPLVDATIDIDINVPNYYDAIQQSINSAWEKEGKDPYEAGLLKHIEDGSLAAPESDTLLLVGGKGGVYGAGPAFVRFDPVTQQYTHLQRNADGTYTPENPQKGEPEFPNITSYKKNSMDPQALLKVQTPNGKKVHLIITQGEKINWAGGYFDLRLYSVEELADITFKDINITLEEQDQYPDDDGDSLVNHEDNCRWRANPDQVNSTADENGDACKADCSEGGWVGVDAPLQTNSSGLRICKSELGFNFAFSFEDGSTIHSNMDVGVLNGKIELKPGQKIRFIHLWDPRTEKLSSPNISLPSGNSIKIKVNSSKNLDGTNGQMVFNHDGAAEYFSGVIDWQDFGIIGAGEIEGASDVEIEVGNENPLPVAETQAEQTQTTESVQITEVSQTAEIPSQVEISAQVETPLSSAEETGIAVAEQPNVAEQSSVAEISVVAEPILDVFSGNPEPDAQGEIAEEIGGAIVPHAELQQSEPQVETTQVEPAPDVIQGYDTYDIASDIAQSSDTSVGTDTQHDSPLTETPSSQDSAQDTATADTAQDSAKDTVESNQDALPANIDQATSTDTPVQSKDTQFGTLDVSQGDDIAEKPILEEKSEGGGGGCNCAIENPDNNFSAEIFTMFGAAIATWLVNRRRQLKKILTHD